jgi:hypothetical protein
MGAARQSRGTVVSGPTSQSGEARCGKKAAPATNERGWGICHTLNLEEQLQGSFACIADSGELVEDIPDCEGACTARYELKLGVVRQDVIGGWLTM